MKTQDELSEFTEEQLKWLWMCNYCKRKGIPSAQSWAWCEAEEAWLELDEYIKSVQKGEHNEKLANTVF